MKSVTAKHKPKMVNMPQLHHLVPKQYHNITANTVLTAMLKIIMMNHIIQVALNTTGAVMSMLIKVADKDTANQRAVNQSLTNAGEMIERIFPDKKNPKMSLINRQAETGLKLDQHQKQKPPLVLAFSKIEKASMTSKAFTFIRMEVLLIQMATSLTNMDMTNLEDITMETTIITLHKNNREQLSLPKHAQFSLIKDIMTLNMIINMTINNTTKMRANTPIPSVVQIVTIRVPKEKLPMLKNVGPHTRSKNTDTKTTMIIT